MRLKWNDDLGCFEKEYVPMAKAEYDLQFEELHHRDGCYDCGNRDTCWSASKLGLPCEDWEEDDGTN
jgi:hypothetical protein